MQTILEMWTICLFSFFNDITQQGSSCMYSFFYSKIVLCFHSMHNDDDGTFVVVNNNTHTKWEKEARKALQGSTRKYHNHMWIVITPYLRIFHLVTCARHCASFISHWTRTTYFFDSNVYAFCSQLHMYPSPHYPVGINSAKNDKRKGNGFGFFCSDFCYCQPFNYSLKWSITRT